MDVTVRDAHHAAEEQRDPRARLRDGRGPRWRAFGAAAWLLGGLAWAVSFRRPEEGPAAGVGVTVLGALYAGGLPAFLLLLRHSLTVSGPWAGTAMAGLPLVTTWLCDTFAMTGGALFGGPRMAPVLSPKKTWSGAVSGTVGALLTVLVYGRWIMAPLGAPVGAGTLLMLQAPSLHSMASDVRYGGQQFDTDGHIGTPSTPSVAPGENGDYSFTLPNASAAVLSVAR